MLIIACGGRLRHALVVEHQLRPFFEVFEALTMWTAVYACAPELDAESTVTGALAARRETGVAQLAASLGQIRCAA